MLELETDMAFSIQITNENIDLDVYDEPAVKGFIEFGNYREDLLISLLVWSQVDYLRQWLAGLHKILSSDRSCLITSMRDLMVSDFINCWMLYKIGNEVFFKTKFLCQTCHMLK